VRRQSLVRCNAIQSYLANITNTLSAEHRGPGVHHGFDDGAEDFDMHMDMDSRARPFGALGGRIIVLGDGSGNGGQSIEVDSDMFDHEDEDRDLESQVTKGTPSGSEDESEAADHEERSLREGTPAPTSSSTDTLSSKRHTGSPSSTQTEQSTGSESKPQAAEEKKLADEVKAKAAAEAPVAG
jgi:protein phosphatase 2C family protein 2/3